MKVNQLANSHSCHKEAAQADVIQELIIEGVGCASCVGKIREVALSALSPGEYPFTCQMQMYRGDLVVREE
jgi:plastocyanin domain-containing protein